VAEWYVRSATIDTLQLLKDRVRACLQAGADAAGCRMEIHPTCPEYCDLRTNPALIDLYRANSEALGRPLADPSPVNRVVASTDMGNVSHWVPSIHPMIALAPPDVPLHTAEFAGWAGSESGDKAVLEGAKALAMTVVDLWLDPGALAEVRATFGSGP
jgi:metal-dependent amidase/aminoacylase/carboxypeptidase family protein